MHSSIAAYRSTARAFVVIFFTSLFFFYGFGLNNCFNALETPLVNTYHLSPSAVGWISSLFFWANVISLMPMGALVDRLSPKKVILCALLLTIITVFAIAYSHQLWVLGAARFLMGVGGGCIFVGCMRIAVNWFDLPKMARVSGFIVTMGMFGGYMVQSPFISLINAFGWRDALGMVGCVGIVVAILIAIFVKDHPNGLEKDYAHAAQSQAIMTSLLMVLKNKQNWLAGLAGSLNNLPIFVLGALWGVPYLMKVNGLTNTQAGTVSGMLYFGTMVGSPLLGFVSDSIKKRKLPMIIGIVASIVIIELCVRSSGWSVLTLSIMFFLLGMSASAQVLAYPIVAESNAHSVISTATSIISMQMLLGGAITEPLFGYIVEKVGGATAAQYTAHSYTVAIEILPVAFVIALVVALFIRETNAKRMN